MGLLDTISGIISGGAGAISRAIGGAASQVQSAAQSGYSNVARAAQSAASTAGQYASSGYSYAASRTGSVVTALSTPTTIASTMLNTGSNQIQNISSMQIPSLQRQAEGISVSPAVSMFQKKVTTPSEGAAIRTQAAPSPTVQALFSGAADIFAGAAKTAGKVAQPLILAAATSPIVGPLAVGAIATAGVASALTGGERKQAVASQAARGGALTEGPSFTAALLPTAAAPAGITLYTPFGNIQQQKVTGISNVIVGQESGVISAYEVPYGHSISNIVAGGGPGAAQSGMFSTKPLTPVVLTQRTAELVPEANRAAAEAVLKSPESFSRLGAEYYGGKVEPLAGGRLYPEATLSRYPAETGNLANLVNPTGVNLEKQYWEQTPWRIEPTTTPAWGYVSLEGKISPISTGALKEAGIATTSAGIYSVTKTVGGAAETRQAAVQPQTISEQGSYFKEVAGFFKNAPILGLAYSAGASVDKGTAQNIQSFVQSAPVLEGVYKGGQVFELYKTYEKQAVKAEAEVSPLTKQYESDLSTYNKSLSEYNTKLEAYNKNKTGGGYSELTSLKTDLDKKYASLQLQESIITEKLSASDQSKAAYEKAASSLMGSTDQSKLTTYGVGSAIGGVGKWYSSTIEKPISSAMTGYGIGGQFVVGLAELPAQVATTGQALLVGGETLLRNPPVVAGVTVAGLAMMAAGTYELATTNPGKFAGSLVGQYLLFKGGEKIYEAQPYRIGFQKAEIISSKGSELPTAKYTSFGISKLSGAEQQIEQVSASIIGIGGKTQSPTEVILGSDLLKGESNGTQFTTKMNVFGSSREALASAVNMEKLGTQTFYHATEEGAFTNTLLSKGSVAVGEGGEGALFFAQPDTILTQFAGAGTKVAIRLEETPKVTTDFLGAVQKLRSGSVGSYGAAVSEATKSLPAGTLYPGLRAVAGKSWKGVGLEEEYIIPAGTKVYLKGVEHVTSPVGEEWVVADVSLKRPIFPDLRYGAAKAAATIENIRPYTGTPKPAAELFSFTTEEGVTYAANTPLETAIIRNLAPSEKGKIDLAYNVDEITSGSGMKYEQAATAIGEVVKARNFPNQPEVTEAILQTSIDYGVKLYGSAGQKAAGIERGVTTMIRNPNDIDVMVPSAENLPGKTPFIESIKMKLGGIAGEPKATPTGQMGESFASDVTAAINKAAGKEVVYIDEAGTVQLSDKSGKLFDIHNEVPTTKELLEQGASPFRSESGYYGVGRKPQKYDVSVEGVEVMKYSEQVGRKASGASEFTSTPRTIVSKEYTGGPSEFSVTGQIAPRMEGRMKDIGDYYIGEKGNIELMGRSANPQVRAQAAKADVYLEQWLDLWGEDAATKIRANYAEGRFAVDLKDLSKPTTKPSTTIPTSPAVSAAIAGIVAPRQSPYAAPQSPKKSSVPSYSVEDISQIGSPPVSQSRITSPFGAMSGSYSGFSEPSRSPNKSQSPLASISASILGSASASAPSQSRSISLSPDVSYGISPSTPASTASSSLSPIESPSPSIVTSLKTPSSITPPSTPSTPSKPPSEPPIISIPPPPPPFISKWSSPTSESGGKDVLGRRYFPFKERYYAGLGITSKAFYGKSAIQTRPATRLTAVQPVQRALPQRTAIRFRSPPPPTKRKRYII